jgi:hypothetical protein
MRGYSRVRVIPRQVIAHSRTRMVMLHTILAGVRRTVLPDAAALRVIRLYDPAVISQLLRQLPEELQDD